jgi:hypothetical protein
MHLACQAPFLHATGLRVEAFTACPPSASGTVGYRPEIALEKTCSSPQSFPREVQRLAQVQKNLGKKLLFKKKALKRTFRSEFV